MRFVLWSVLCVCGCVIVDNIPRITSLLRMPSFNTWRHNATVLHSSTNRNHWLIHKLGVLSCFPRPPGSKPCLANAIKPCKQTYTQKPLPYNGIFSPERVVSCHTNEHFFRLLIQLTVQSKSTHLSSENMIAEIWPTPCRNEKHR